MASWSSIAWAGLADEATKKPVDGDTMFMLSSTTKGVTATCMHILVEKHKLDYDMPIVKVWPEFGAHGKDRPRPCVTRLATRPVSLKRQSVTRQTGWPTGTRCAAASPT